MSRLKLVRKFLKKIKKKITFGFIDNTKCYIFHKKDFKKINCCA